MRNAHYGCETCGKKLADKNADKRHLIEMQKNTAACQATMRNGPPFEIGIDLFDKMENIYDDKKFTNEEKWIK